MVIKTEDALPHQLRRATQAWTAMWQQQFDDLSAPQFSVLSVVHAQGPLGQTALGAVTAIDRSTLTTLIDGLEVRGLLTRTIDPTNRRSRIVALTDEGRAYLEEATAKAARIFEHLTDHFGDDDLRRLVILLRRLGDTPPPPEVA